MTQNHKHSKAHFVIGKLSSEHAKKNSAYLFAVACLVGCIVVLSLAVRSIKSEEKVFVLDESNTISIGHLHSLKNNVTLYQKIALVAAQAILQVSPIGLDLPEIAESLLSDKAYKKLCLEVNENLSHFKVKNLHQKPEIDVIETIKEIEGKKFVRVRGQLIRAGSFGGYPISESKEFVLVVAFIRNPKLSDRGQYPFIIADYMLKEGEA